MAPDYFFRILGAKREGFEPPIAMRGALRHWRTVIAMLEEPPRYDQSSKMDCVFCERLTRGDLVAANDLAVAFLDAFPLNEGHCLIVPRRHEGDFLALTREEHRAIWALLDGVRRRIETTRVPDGYNIGINIGEAAGQTVPHAHLHVIPRYRGDVLDPRGGIRWIIPTKAQYWEPQ